VKFSKKTFEILKNFSTINSNILVKPGNKIGTITPSKNVMAEAVVDEDFGVEFGIWDLSKFLGTISLFQDPEFEFESKCVLVKSSTGSCVKYYYSEPSLLTVPQKRLTMPDTVVSFNLTQSTFNEIQRAASVLQLPDLAIRSVNGSIVATVLDINEPTSNDYEIVVGVNDTESEFDFHFKIENLRFIPGDYTVNITEKIVSEFVNTAVDVTYWVALESTSKYSG
jgi:hypothetical protein|tara:strand:+ start:744 stop:1415 length:672 start_codon:yes stop_codon:yes gene_type:complete